MKVVNRKKHGFRLRSVQRKKEPHAFHYLSQRASFWIASFSVIAFITGNMMGQYGWHTFWASVLGKTDDSLIVYTGAVTPVASVPDYTRWAKFGGNIQEHTFAQVPKDFLVPLPGYDSKEQHKTYEESPGDVFSMGHMGSYETGAEDSGSHVGVDIRTPIGTPVRSVMNGIVDRVEEEEGSGGMGKMVIVRHPNVPDPKDPKKTTTLYSIYGHLSANLVTEGTIVNKGAQIALSGKTGFATGPHLHFQIDRDEAPWHPFWPFSGQDQRTAGLSFTGAVDKGLNKEQGQLYTIHPMLYVQSNYAPVRTTVASADPTTTVLKTDPKAAAKERALSRATRTQTRREQRLARKPVSQPSVAVHSAAPAPSPTVLSRTTVVTASPEQLPPLAGVTIEITHDGGFNGREWEAVRIRVLDSAQNVVRYPDLQSDIYLRTAFGDAEFKPAVVSELDFNNGTSTVQMLPRGRRTVIVEVQPYNVLSKPMAFEGQ